MSTPTVSKPRAASSTVRRPLPQGASRTRAGGDRPRTPAMKSASARVASGGVAAVHRSRATPWKKVRHQSGSGSVMASSAVFLWGRTSRSAQEAGRTWTSAPTKGPSADDFGQCTRPAQQVDRDRQAVQFLAAEAADAHGVGPAAVDAHRLVGPERPPEEDVVRRRQRPVLRGRERAEEHLAPLTADEPQLPVLAERHDGRGGSRRPAAGVALLLALVLRHAAQQAGARADVEAPPPAAVAQRRAVAPAEAAAAAVAQDAVDQHDVDGDEVLDVIADVVLHRGVAADVGADLGEDLVPGAPDLTVEVAVERAEVFVEGLGAVVGPLDALAAQPVEAQLPPAS